MTEIQHQIARFDNKDKFVEVLSHSFGIGKIILQFETYNQNLPKGQRNTGRIPIYMDFQKALSFAESILNGSLAKDLKAASTAVNSWEKQVTIIMSGTSQAGLNAQNRPRPDGKAESRVLKVQIGQKFPVMLTATLGPGDVTSTGLIQPTKGAKTDTQIMIGFDKNSIRELAVLIKTHIQAYLTAEYMRGAWAVTPEQRNFNNGDGGQPPVAPPPPVDNPPSTGQPVASNNAPTPPIANGAAPTAPTPPSPPQFPTAEDMMGDFPFPNFP